MTSNQKILFLGFSETASGDGYTKFLIPSLSESLPGLKTLRCGFGGLTPPIVPSALKTILAQNTDITHVVLELSTSLYAWTNTASIEEIKKIVIESIYTCESKNISPLFLLLNRNHPTSPNININKIISDICSKYQVGYLDLSDNLTSRHGNTLSASPHDAPLKSNSEGGQLISDLARPFIVNWMSASAVTSIIEKPNEVTSFLPFAEVLNRKADGRFKRQDFIRKYVEFGEGNDLHVKFPKPTKLLGFTYILGPNSGNFKVTFKDGSDKWLQVRGFDEHSHYSRLGSKPINNYKGRIVRSMTFRFEDWADNIQLLKGDRTQEPCTIRLVDAIIEEKTFKYSDGDENADVAK